MFLKRLSVIYAVWFINMASFLLEYFFHECSIGGALFYLFLSHGSTSCVPEKSSLETLKGQQAPANVKAFMKWVETQLQWDIYWNGNHSETICTSVSSNMVSHKCYLCEFNGLLVSLQFLWLWRISRNTKIWDHWIKMIASIKIKVSAFKIRY